jgi:hypothetical protein
MKYDLEKLNSNNYQVNEFHNGEFQGHYYIQYGLRGLYNLSKTTDSNFKLACIELLERGYTYMRNKELEICLI